MAPTLARKLGEVPHGLAALRWRWAIQAVRPSSLPTRDVDAILPLSWLAAHDGNQDFWRAQQRANAELQPHGLYVTHLFRELEVILSPEWLSRRVRIPIELCHLVVYRPSTLDLILTKMARCDENDLSDIQFLLHQEALTAAQLRAAFASARVPDVAEIQELFRACQSRVLALVGNP